MRFQRITKSFGPKTVLKELELVLNSQEITCLLGPSGCGKTTLLRVGAGLESADRGTVSNRPAKVSFVFQEDRLLPWYNALENMTVLGIPKEHCLEVLTALGLGKEAETLPQDMSGGMKRRLAIARALAFGGNYFFLDEPCRGLDESTKSQVLLYLKHSLSGKGALLITHDHEEALALSDRILICIGPPLIVKKEFLAGDSMTAAELSQYIHTIEQEAVL